MFLISKLISQHFTFCKSSVMGLLKLVFPAKHFRAKQTVQLIAKNTKKPRKVAKNDFGCVEKLNNLNNGFIYILYNSINFILFYVYLDHKKAKYISSPRKYLCRNIKEIIVVLSLNEISVTLCVASLLISVILFFSQLLWQHFLGLQQQQILVFPDRKSSL